MTNSDISLVINSIDSKPMAFEEIYIDRIRKSLIDDKYTKKMSESNKIKSIDEVNSINLFVDKETIHAVTNDKNTLACYFKYIE
jgi:hypothetical protein